VPTCTVCRTHRLGRPLPQGEWEFVPGPVNMFTIYREIQRRWVRCLQVIRPAGGGKHQESPFPDLFDVEIVSLSTDRAMMAVGYEEINGARYYQGWYVVWG
jgi:hypothetical protein